MKFFYMSLFLVHLVIVTVTSYNHKSTKSRIKCSTNPFSLKLDSADAELKYNTPLSIWIFKSRKFIAKSLLQSTMLLSLLSSNTPLAQIQVSSAGEPLPSLEKCFNAVRKELDPIEGESIKRLADDIQSNKWEDIKLFTREYDAGFRGYVMKSTWKQIDNEAVKKKGIEISNSFTFDLIALNKASRIKDTQDAYKRLDDVRKDLQDFLTLENQIKTN